MVQFDTFSHHLYHFSPVVYMEPARWRSVGGVTASPQRRSNRCSISEFLVELHHLPSSEWGLMQNWGWIKAISIFCFIPQTDLPVGSCSLFKKMNLDGCGRCVDGMILAAPVLCLFARCLARWFFLKKVCLWRGGFSSNRFTCRGFRLESSKTESTNPNVPAQAASACVISTIQNHTWC